MATPRTRTSKTSTSKTKYDVLLTQDAEQDLESLYDYLTEFDCWESANYVLEQLSAVIDTLSLYPLRGSYPKELNALGIREYRQVFFKPYRVIYRLFSTQVIIYVIVDGRRDMQSLLTRRLL
jgi:toxin ParE1/3/4